MSKTRLDNRLVKQGLTSTRSQAESYIRLGLVKVNSKVITKPGAFVPEQAQVQLNAEEQYVSRAALKLASVSDNFKLSFKDQIVLDVGSSTGGFSDFALRQGAKKVYSVEKGTDQLHLSLRNNPKIELHEKTDIRDFYPKESPDIVVIDVSFMSVREILSHISQISSKKTTLVVMVKPQFEAKESDLKHKGVIKNDRLRRQILKDFEDWVVKSFVVIAKADSGVAGSKGNLERFYCLKSKAC